MSFNKRFTGQAAVIMLAIAAFPAEQRAVDEGCGQGVIDGHQRQIGAGIGAIGNAVAVLPEGLELDVSLWGHANADESGTYGYRIQASGIPTPLATPAPTD